MIFLTHRKLITLIGLTFSFLLVANQSQAQVARFDDQVGRGYLNGVGGNTGGTNDPFLGSGSSSNGRIAGNRIDFTSFATLKRVRALINEGNNEDAAIKAITYISQMEGVRKDGMETPYYAAAYNELCVSSTNESTFWSNFLFGFQIW